MKRIAPINKWMAYSEPPTTNMVSLISLFAENSDVFKVIARYLAKYSISAITCTCSGMGKLSSGFPRARPRIPEVLADIHNLYDLVYTGFSTDITDYFPHLCLSLYREDSMMTNPWWNFKETIKCAAIVRGHPADKYDSYMRVKTLVRSGGITSEHILDKISPEYLPWVPRYAVKHGYIDATKMIFQNMNVNNGIVYALKQKDHVSGIADMLHCLSDMHDGNPARSCVIDLEHEVIYGSTMRVCSQVYMMIDMLEDDDNTDSVLYSDYSKFIYGPVFSSGRYEILESLKAIGTREFFRRAELSRYLYAEFSPEYTGKRPKRERDISFRTPEQARDFVAAFISMEHLHPASLVWLVVNLSMPVLTRELLRAYPRIFPVMAYCDLNNMVFDIPEVFNSVVVYMPKDFEKFVRAYDGTTWMLRRDALDIYTEDYSNDTPSYDELLLFYCAGANIYDVPHCIGDIIYNKYDNSDSLDVLETNKQTISQICAMGSIIREYLGLTKNMWDV